MKKILIISFCVLAAASCVKRYEPQPASATADDVERLLTAAEFEVPVRSGYVTRVSVDGDIVAEAVTPMTIMLPKTGTAVRSASGQQVDYVPYGDYPNEITENTAKLYQVVCFEDSEQADYDYNDLVIHVVYKTQGDKFGFAVHPVALGSSKPIRLGYVVYKGAALVAKGLLTPEGKDCRQQYFESQQGHINTVGTVINQQNGGWHGFLGSTIRYWNTEKISGNGAMRVEWYIEVDNGKELYALSTKYLDRSFDKQSRPYGLVITETGSQYIDKGMVCGKDWFNYPQEGRTIADVYPPIWEWIDSDKSYNFADIYDGAVVPAGAFPASDLGLYVTDSDVDIFLPKYAQN